MRLALLAPTSSDIAVLIRSRPTTSPIITRRTGLSVTPAAPVDEAGERELPNLELSGPVQKCEDRRSATHQKHDDEERSSAIKAFGNRAEKHREQAHRKQTEHGHHRDQKRRIGALLDDNSDRNGFHPARKHQTGRRHLALELKR
jgi:hypothetical protein